MAGLLDNPANAMMLLNGLGLLTAKYQDQFDSRMGNISQGLLQQSQFNAKSKEKQAEREFEQPLRDARIENLTAKTNNVGAANSPNFGLQPFFATDASGNTIAFQLNNKGGIQQIPLPEGYNPAIPTRPIDLGDRYGLVNKFGQVGDVTASTNPTGSKPTAPLIKNVDPAQTPEHQAAVVTAKEEAKAEVSGKQDLGKEIDSAQAGIDLIDKIRNHPGRKISTGGSAFVGSALSMVPGTDATDFSALLEQLKGKQFLEAFQELKGGGTITEVEGLKAEQALSNMDKSQSEEQFLENLKVLEDVMLNGMNRAKSRSRGVVNWEDL